MTESQAWSLTRKEIIPVSPERAWQALTTAGELSTWWCEEATIDPVIGGEFLFRGNNVYASGDSPDTVPPGAVPPRAMQRCTITELIEGSLLRFRWRLGDVDTVVTFEVVNRLELAEVQVTQTAARAPLDWRFGDERPNWWWLALPALRSFLESGAVALRIDYSLAESDPPLTFSVDVTTFPWAIWAKLTAAEEVARWWGSNVEIDPCRNGRFTFESAESGRPTTILAIDEERLFCHNWVWSDGTESRVEWSMEETDDATRVTLRDCGPWPMNLRRDYHFIYWASTLLYLKQMSERGVTPREYQRF